MDSEERDEHPRERRGWLFRKEEGHEYGCACVRLCVFLLQLAAAKQTGGVQVCVVIRSGASF